ncbi:MAG TPA: NAD-dependent epimerase/dehydratase family protein [Euzebyales bacterium]|nr:NAD-dependent epimerase/dehydratase family protein [Euzebyales bacterium]
MRAVVTGGAGFIGSHLCEHLLAQGHEVVALDDLSTGSPINLLPLLDHPAFTFVRGSVLDEVLVDRLVAAGDQIFHLAAAVGVHTILEDPLRSLRVNVDGAQTVLDAALRHDRRVLIASTSEVYGKNTAERLDEESDRILGSPFKARWSYATAKAIDELVARTYWETHGLQVVVVRLFNTVGPRQSGRYGMVVPRLVEQALREQALTVHGDGTQTRCFCHVGDIVPALAMLLGTQEAFGEAVNLGNPVETSIVALAQQVRSITGSSAGVRFVPYSDAYGSGYEDMRRRVPDIAKAQRLIDFAPRHDLVRIIADVADDQRTRQLLEGLRWRGPQPTDGALAAEAAAPGSPDGAPQVTAGPRPLPDDNGQRAVVGSGTVAW